MFFNLLCYFVLGLNLLSNGQMWQDRKPIVRIKQGLIEGAHVYTDSSRIANSYLGVPYAMPPLDNLRFLPPQKHPGWNGTLQALNFRSYCPQLPLKAGINDNEDCLYLNIWTPEKRANSPPIPVIVFFEGIDFYKNTELHISGQDLAVEGLVVVTVNYRLNVFGFFCLASNNARGNQGLLDQYFAMLWIRENIKQFGGDPEKLTIYGHSSGAVSVALHMASPRTAGLFQRAIMSAGSAVSPWQLTNDPIAASKEILRMLGCAVYTVDALACIRAKRVEEILKALQEYSDSNVWTDLFLPVVDSFLPAANRYLPEAPDKVFKEGNFLQVPILTGLTNPITNPQYTEWIQFASQGYSQLQQYVERAKIPEIMRLYRFSTNSREQIFDLIKWKYASGNEGDVRVLFDQIKQLEYEAKTEAPHFLQLSYLLSSYVQPMFVYYLEDIGFVVNTTDGLIATDLLLIFGPELLKQTGRRRFSSIELNLSNSVKQMWKNFVFFGNPTPTNNGLTNWRKYTVDDAYIENFNRTRFYSNEEIKRRNERLLFWNHLLPKISKSRSALSNNIPKELQNSPDPAAGFRHAMYTLVALVIALLSLLLICIILLKKRSKDRERHLHMGY